ncbi:feruloyl CoA ortho-hydroxylase 1-like [Solanum dulcamara]|uniref:feruloyl CoA ortho-hydroxylase 1-like n=1 Tax=Solanum dulcamara TaxID=45834 RepID=UPI00248595A4|nr:feruloyl CoA ortho-hydroxylase 1-like [Solanum dulcamara]
MVGRMRESSASPNGSFTSAMTLTEEGLTYVPKRYILPPSLRLDGTLCNTCLPIVDLSNRKHPLLRPQIIHEVHLACKEFGFFQVVNHGIPLSVMDDAIDAASEFFDLPTQDKRPLWREESRCGEAAR